MNKMSTRQSWAIFCAMKLDVRKLNISSEQASDFLARFNNGDNNVINELITLGATSKGNNNQRNNWQQLWDKAHQAGLEAANNHTPTPMVVQQHQNACDDNSPVTKQWYVPQGVCGFAWVNIRPGNCSFANWLKKNNLARSAYRGGVDIWIRDFGQSMELKEKYARAFAKVITNAGIKAYPQSRMD